MCTSRRCFQTLTELQPTDRSRCLGHCSSHSHQPPSDSTHFFNHCHDSCLARNRHRPAACASPRISHARSRTHARTHAHTHTHARTHTYTRTLTHTYTRTHATHSHSHAHTRRDRLQASRRPSGTGTCGSSTRRRDTPSGLRPRASTVTLHETVQARHKMLVPTPVAPAPAPAAAAMVVVVLP
jgi:hypothetical protein